MPHPFRQRSTEIDLKIYKDVRSNLSAVYKVLKDLGEEETSTLVGYALKDVEEKVMSLAIKSIGEEAQGPLTASPTPTSDEALT